MITVIDPCDQPVSLTASTLVAQDYTITDNSKTYQVPVYNPDPAWCAITYSYSVDAVAGDSAIASFNSDASVREFTFEQLTDLSLCGPVSTDYTVTVNGEIGITTLQTASASFTLTLKNPCIDSNFVTFANPAINAQQYELYEHDPPGFQFTHDPVTISTQPITHSLCGLISYTSTFMTAGIDGILPMDDITVNPVGYDPANLRFTVYSEDFDLLGSRDLTVQAYLVEYPQIVSVVSTTTIEFLDPCPDPEQVNSVTQTNPDDYYYTAQAPKMQFTLTPFQVEPPVCPFTYSCIMTGGPAGVPDLCALTDGDSHSVFNPITGNFEFYSINMATYLPGQYTFEITGTVGTKSAKATFMMTLVDPCPTTLLTINQPDPFEDQTYVLRDSQIDQFWDINNLITKATLVDCGGLTVEFFNDDMGQTALDTDLFLDDQTTFNFAIKETDVVAKAAIYPIKYRVYHTNYAQNVVTLLNPFEVTVIDPCDKPASISAPLLEAQEYTITDTAKTYQIPVFTPVPAWCDITYSYQVEVSAGGNAVSFDALVRQFTFDYTADLSLCGLESIDYIVTVSGEIGITEKQTDHATFILTLKNPCIDANFVNIEPQVLSNQNYELHEHDPLGLQFTHDPYVVKTVPFSHGYCGDLTYTSTFMNLAISNLDPYADSFNDAVGYNPNTLTHSVYSEDFGLLGIQSYTVTAALTTYPSVSAIATADIQFLDPCPDPEQVLSVAQTNPIEYYYTAQNPKMEFTLQPFIVEPPVCDFQYSCGMIAGDRLDLCSINDGDTHGVFDPITGNYQFYSIDMANYLPGSYTFEITGTVGTKSAKATFVMTFVDPCPTTQLNIIQPDPFENQTYILRNNQIDQIWNIDNLITQTTLVDCGPLTVEFFNDDTDKSALDSEIFEDDRTTAGAFNLVTTKYIEDVLKTGYYYIKYRVFHTHYDQNVVTLTDPIEILVADPCDAPISLTESSLDDQEYIITTSSVTYQIQAFTADPSWCDITYSYTVTDPSGGVAVSFDADQTVRTFKFEYMASVGLSGFDHVDYLIEVKALVGIVIKVPATSSFILKLKNPCVEPSLVSIETQPLLDESYVLFEPRKYFYHDEFSVVTLPFQHSMCGLLTYKATFRGNQISIFSNPIKYDTSLREFSIYAEPFSYIGIHEITIQAYLTDYSIIISNIEKSEIDLIDPCIDPKGIEAPIQTNPPTYYYESEPVYFILNPFQSVPPGCDITYSCFGTSSPDVRCDISGVTTFDEIDGTWTFQSLDLYKYQMGTYTITLQGQTGINSFQTTFAQFELKLDNPCLGASLTLKDDQPMNNMNHSIRDSRRVQTQYLLDFVHVNARDICGNLTIIFYNNDDYQSALNEELFTVDAYDQIVDFYVNEVEDTNLAGEYHLSYAVFLEEYNFVRQDVLDAFKVNVVNPCLDNFQRPGWCPNQIVEVEPGFYPEWMEAIEDQEVTIGGEDLIYDMGEPKNIYEQIMSVQIQGGFADLFIQYDPFLNRFLVDQVDLVGDIVGQYKVDVLGSYEGIDGEIQKFKTSFILTVNPPDQQPEEIIEEPVDSFNREEGVIYIDEWQDEMQFDIVSQEAQQYKRTQLDEQEDKKNQNQIEIEKPIPYIVDFSSTGLMHIGWTDIMKPPPEIQMIPPSLVAVESENLEQSGLRRLNYQEQQSTLDQDALFKSKDGQYEQMLKIVHALQIAVQPRDSDEEEVPIEYTYELVEFNADSIFIQFNFEQPDSISHSLTDEWDIEVTFWGTKYFKNLFDVEVPLGTKLRQPIVRQMKKEDAEQIEATEAAYIAPLIMALTFCLLVALCGGRLLPTWMFLNSMQLILHVILLKTDMPSHAHQFIQNFLDKLRLKFDWTDQMTEDNVGSPAQSDYEAMQQDEYFSVYIKSSGYHYNWLNNLFIFIMIALLIFVIWFLLLLKDYIMRKFMKKQSSNEAFMTNFSLRFLYEIIFEICLCTILYLTLTQNRSTVVLAICIMTILAIFASLVFCLSRVFVNGPYVKQCYQKGTLMKSFWAVRPIDYTKIENYEAIDDLEKAKQNKVAPVSQRRNDYNIPIDNAKIQNKMMNEEEDSVCFQQNQNQQMQQQAENLNQPQQQLFEGGTDEIEAMTDRQLMTQRNYNDNTNEKHRHKYQIDKTEKELKLEALMRVNLQFQVQLNPRYKTLFYGLKMNHPRQITVLYPILYLIRRIVYIVLILFMTQLPFVGIVILMLWCLATLSIVWTEAQWEDQLINVQHAVNEIALYLVLLQVAIFSGLTPAAITAGILGWVLIGTIMVIVVFNIAVIIYMSIVQLKLICLKFYKVFKIKNPSKQNSQSDAAKSPTKVKENKILSKQHSSDYTMEANQLLVNNKTNNNETVVSPERRKELIEISPVKMDLDGSLNDDGIRMNTDRYMKDVNSQDEISVEKEENSSFKSNSPKHLLLKPSTPKKQLNSIRKKKISAKKEDQALMPSNVELEVVEYLHQHGEHLTSPQVKNPNSDEEDERFKSPCIEEENPINQTMMLSPPLQKSDVKSKEAISSFKPEKTTSQFKASVVDSPFIEIKKDIDDIYLKKEKPEQAKEITGKVDGKSQERSSFEPSCLDQQSNTSRKLWSQSPEQQATKEDPDLIQGVEQEVVKILGQQELERSIISIEEDEAINQKSTEEQMQQLTSILPDKHLKPSDDDTIQIEETAVVNQSSEEVSNHNKSSSVDDEEDIVEKPEDEHQVAAKMPQPIIIKNVEASSVSQNKMMQDNMTPEKEEVTSSHFSPDSISKLESPTIEAVQSSQVVKQEDQEKQASPLLKIVSIEQNRRQESEVANFAKAQDKQVTVAVKPQKSKVPIVKKSQEQQVSIKAKPQEKMVPIDTKLLEPEESIMAKPKEPQVSIVTKSQEPEKSMIVIPQVTLVSVEAKPKEQQVPIADKTKEPEIPIAAKPQESEVPISTKTQEPEVSIAAKPQEPSVLIQVKTQEPEAPVVAKSQESEVPISTKTQELKVQIVAKPQEPQVLIESKPQEPEVPVLAKNQESEVPISTKTQEPKVSIVAKPQELQVLEFPPIVAKPQKPQSMSSKIKQPNSEQPFSQPQQPQVPAQSMPVTVTAAASVEQTQLAISFQQVEQDEHTTSVQQVEQDELTTSVQQVEQEQSNAHIVDINASSLSYFKPETASKITLSSEEAADDSQRPIILDSSQEVLAFHESPEPNNQHVESNNQIAITIDKREASDTLSPKATIALNKQSTKTAKEIEVGDIIEPKKAQNGPKFITKKQQPQHPVVVNKTQNDHPPAALQKQVTQKSKQSNTDALKGKPDEQLYQISATKTENNAQDLVTPIGTPSAQNEEQSNTTSKGVEDILVATIPLKNERSRDSQILLSSEEDSGGDFQAHDIEVSNETAAPSAVMDVEKNIIDKCLIIKEGSNSNSSKHKITVEALSEESEQEEQEALRHPTFTDDKEEEEVEQNQQQQYNLNFESAVERLESKKDKGQKAVKYVVKPEIQQLSGQQGKQLKINKRKTLSPSAHKIKSPKHKKTTAKQNGKSMSPSRAQQQQQADKWSKKQRSKLSLVKNGDQQQQSRLSQNNTQCPMADETPLENIEHTGDDLCIENSDDNIMLTASRGEKQPLTLSSPTRTSIKLRVAGKAAGAEQSKKQGPGSKKRDSSVVKAKKKSAAAERSSMPPSTLNKKATQGADKKKKVKSRQLAIDKPLTQPQVSKIIQKERNSVMEEPTAQEQQYQEQLNQQSNDDDSVVVTPPIMITTDKRHLRVVNYENNSNYDYSHRKTKQDISPAAAEQLAISGSKSSSTHRNNSRLFGSQQQKDLQHFSQSKMLPTSTESQIEQTLRDSILNNYNNENSHELTKEQSLRIHESSDESLMQLQQYQIVNQTAEDVNKIKIVDYRQVDKSMNNQLDGSIPTLNLMHQNFNVNKTMNPTKMTRQMAPTESQNSFKLPALAAQDNTNNQSQLFFSAASSQSDDWHHDRGLTIVGSDSMLKTGYRKSLNKVQKKDVIDKSQKITANNKAPIGMLKVETVDPTPIISRDNSLHGSLDDYMDKSIKVMEEEKHHGQMFPKGFVDNINSIHKKLTMYSNDLSEQSFTESQKFLNFDQLLNQNQEITLEPLEQYKMKQLVQQAEALQMEKKQKEVSRSPPEDYDFMMSPYGTQIMVDEFSPTDNHLSNSNNNSRHQMMHLHNSIRQKAKVEKTYLQTKQNEIKKKPQQIMIIPNTGKFERVPSIHAKMKRIKHARDKVMKHQPWRAADDERYLQSQLQHQSDLHMMHNSARDNSPSQDRLCQSEVMRAEQKQQQSSGNNSNIKFQFNPFVMYEPSTQRKSHGASGSVLDQVDEGESPKEQYTISRGAHSKPREQFGSAVVDCWNQKYSQRLNQRSETMLANANRQRAVLSDKKIFVPFKDGLPLQANHPSSEMLLNPPKSLSQVMLAMKTNSQSSMMLPQHHHHPQIQRIVAPGGGSSSSTNNNIEESKQKMLEDSRPLRKQESMVARPINAQNQIITSVGKAGGRYQRDVMDIMPVKLATRKRSYETQKFFDEEQKEVDRSSQMMQNHQQNQLHQSQRHFMNSNASLQQEKSASNNQAAAGSSRLQRMQEGLERHKQLKRQVSESQILLRSLNALNDKKNRSSSLMQRLREEQGVQQQHQELEEQNDNIEGEIEQQQQRQSQRSSYNRQQQLKEHDSFVSGSDRHLD